MIREAEQARESQENILRALLELEGEGQSVELEELEERAEAEDFQRALSELTEENLINKEGECYRLTVAGRELAQRVLDRHEATERFFTEVLGESQPRAHEIAQRLEHLISQEALKTLERSLALREHSVPLSALNEGGKGVVTAVGTADTELFGRLIGLGISPGSAVEIVQGLPDGSLILNVNQVKVALAGELAQHVLIKAQER
jgi:Mn-dependent DtxR family transcriptional regulator